MKCKSIGRTQRRAAWVIGLSLASSAGSAFAQISQVRAELSQARFVPLQSYVHGEVEDDLLFFCGLSGMGFHSRARDGRITFPAEAFNRDVYLFDPESQTTRSASTLTLPRPLRHYLVATNAQAIQVDGFLYIYGGYGPVPETISWTTWDSVIKIDLAAVRHAILNSLDLPESAFTLYHSRAAQVAGGAIVSVGRYFALVGGSKFGGNYADEANFSNVYPEQIHIFDPNLSFTQPVRTYSDPQYRRRDGNVTPITLGEPGNQRPGFIVHIGGFKPGNEVLPEMWEHPIIYDTQSREMMLDVGFTQMMNQYEAPHATFHSAQRGENYIVTLGGLSGANWDGQNFVRNITIPWVTDVNMLTLRNDRVTSETVVGAMLKPITNAELILDPGLPRNAAGQIDFDSLPAGELRLGYFCGGIEAANPGNSAQTVASPRIYDVYATIDKFSLTVSPLRIGQPATLSAEQAQPGTRVTFAYSTRGSGPTFVPSIGLTLDLSQPIVVLGDRTANAEGRAEITLTIPPNTPEADVWLQAIQRESGGAYVKSNPVAGHVGP